jgi:hypothetical protein
MSTARELLDANLHRVFGNRDAASRREAIDAIYTVDVAFSDPEGTTFGRDALEQKAASLIDTAPDDFVFAAEGPDYLGAGTAALAWSFGPAGSPVARGIDVITVEDGRISSLSTLLHR